MRITPADFTSVSPPNSLILGAGEQSHVGHAHFWQRALSRRAVVRTAAGTLAVLGSGLAMPTLAEAHGTSSAPKPIPEVLFGNTPFHIQFPNTEEPSAIYDFNGIVGATEIQGHVSDDLVFDADMRFMQGTYVAMNDNVQHRTFGFV